MADQVAPEFLALQQALIGRYSLELELGRGGMGIVFLARDVALDRPVAIKLLPPAMAAQPQLRERFLREARMAAKLSHPNIIPIHAVEQAGELVFFVMAYVEGQTLGQRVQQKGPLNAREGTRLIQEVAWALAYAHLRGIVHRDVKPDNILLESGSGRALVSDFGIARATDAGGGTQAGEILGTAHFMSPEQACGESLDGRSDLYSLGVVAFYALSGRLPFDAPDVPALLAQHITQPAPTLSSVAPGVPRWLAAAVDRCLAKDPEQRFPTGEALAEAVSQSTELAREMPAPIRVWLTKGEGWLGPLHLWTWITGTNFYVRLAAFVFRFGMPGEERFPLGSLIVLGAPWALLMLYRLYHTQRVLASGYTQEDLRLALRQQIERRREELAFEFDQEPPWWAKLIRRAALGGLAVASGTLAWIFVGGMEPEQLALFGSLFFGGVALTIGGAFLGRLFPGRRLKARDRLLEYRARLMDSWLGRLWHRVASIGVKPAALPAGAAHRPTEVAIGLAVEALFEALPKQTRKELKDLPAVLRRLEAEAHLGRARVDELSAMLDGLGGEAPAAKSESLKTSEAGALVAGEQAKLRSQLAAQRDAAARRLADSVAALENLRLDLLRLKAGVGTVDQLSADLSAARDLQREIDLAIEARREVDAALAHPAPTAANPPSPIPNP